MQCGDLMIDRLIDFTSLSFRGDIFRTLAFEETIDRCYFALQITDDDDDDRWIDVDGRRREIEVLRQKDCCTTSLKCVNCVTFIHSAQ